MLQLLLLLLLKVQCSKAYLLCPRAAAPSYFNYPSDLDCEGKHEYEHGFLNLYVPNIALREIKATVIWKETISCETQYFFFGSYKEKIEVSITPMRLSEALSNYKDGICLSNQKTKEDITCEYIWPKSHTTSLEYCVKMKGELVISKGTILSSTVGDTSHCSLAAKHCLLSNDKHIFWDASSEEILTFKAPTNYPYITVGGRHLINQLSISVKLTDETEYNGKVLRKTKEGFLVDIITKELIKTDNWQKFGTSNISKVKRDTDAERGELTSKIQYVFDYVYSFLGKTPMVCLMVNLHSRIMKQQAQLQPTLYARAALDNTKLVAHATENYLIVSPCIELKTLRLPFFNPNTSSIQIHIDMKNTSILYNVDVHTKEVTLHVQRKVLEWELPLIIEVDGRTMKVYKDKTVEVDFAQYVHSIPVFKHDNILLPHLDLDEAWVYTQGDLSDKAYWNFINSYQETSQIIHQHQEVEYHPNIEEQSLSDLHIPFLSNITWFGGLIDLCRSIGLIGGFVYLIRCILRLKITTIITSLCKITREKDAKTQHSGMQHDDDWGEFRLPLYRSKDQDTDSALD